ncbi:MAG: hypothetical protein QOI27_2930 [Gaiellaceae bacterium]|nr:hypothetical protein [Gaiellaceae bacterium]MDX6474200.1 hypothetical protein [Gaiellaceae bacterium]
MLAPAARDPLDSRRQAVIDHVESEIGRVTARIAPGLTGEVRIPYAGGSETFHAHGWDDAETIEVGTEVVVIERIGPRTVKVSPFEDKEAQ